MPTSVTAVGASPPSYPGAIVHLRPLDLLRTLVSFECVFTLYLFAGQFKSDPRFEWVPIDLTGLFFALTVVAAAFIVLRGSVNLKASSLLLAGFCFAAWMAASMWWSPSSQYALQKTFLFGTVSLGSMVFCGLIVSADPERVRRFLTMVLLFGVWFGIEALIVHLQAEQRTFITLLGANYHGFSRVCSLAALVALVAWLFARGYARSMVLLAVLVMLGYVLLVTGARSPLLGLVVAAVIPLLVGFRTAGGGIRLQRYQVNLVILAIAAAAILAYLLLISSSTTMTLHRLLVMSGGIEEETSARIRLGHYASALGFWNDAPLFGHGVGAWPMLYGVGDIRRHPHNIILEIAVELGFVGLIIFAALLFLALQGVSIARLRNDPLYLCAFLMFVNAFFNALLNDDLSENRVFFAMLGLLAMPMTRSTPATRQARPVETPPPSIAARPIVPPALQQRKR